VTTTAGGAAGFSTGAGGGATTTAGAGGLTTGGVTTAVFSAAGAAGLGTTTAGFSAAGGAVGVAATGAGAAGLAATAGGLAGGAGGCCCSCSLCLSSFITSPGLEILERSIFGLTSVADVLSREEELDLAEKCLRTRSASSSSIELEWVFFSVTPTSSNTSRIALLFTSSSLAKSLIRIFIRSVFPPDTDYAIMITSRFLTLRNLTVLLLPIFYVQPAPAQPRLRLPAVLRSRPVPQPLRHSVHSSRRTQKLPLPLLRQ